MTSSITEHRCNPPQPLPPRDTTPEQHSPQVWRCLSCGSDWHQDYQPGLGWTWHKPATSVRTDTPPVRSGRGTVITVKRHCNGCGRSLGDATALELVIACEGRPLPDVRLECGCASIGDRVRIEAAALAESDDDA
jgi:hypothetical protein